MWGCIRNLGWDLSAKEQLKRAKEILEKAGMDASRYSCLPAPRAPGSRCELTFKEAAELQDAKRVVRVMDHKLPGSEKPVWVDVEKTRAELKPAKLIPRAADLLTEFDRLRTDGGTIDKVLNGNQSKRNNKVVAWTYHGSLQWGKAGRDCYTVGERNQISASAENWGAFADSARHRAVGIASMSCGRAAGSFAAILSTLDVARKVANWFVIWLCELDAMHGTTVILMISTRSFIHTFLFDIMEEVEIPQ